MGKIGFWEIAIILIIILVLFGGRKIPELMKGLGKGIHEFKTGMNGDEDKKKDGGQEKEAGDKKKE